MIWAPTGRFQSYILFKQPGKKEETQTRRSTPYFLETYSDVRQSNINPFVHYLKYGRFENRGLNDQ